MRSLRSSFQGYLAAGRETERDRDLLGWALLGDGGAIDGRRLLLRGLVVFGHADLERGRVVTAELPGLFGVEGRDGRPEVRPLRPPVSAKMSR